MNSPKHSPGPWTVEDNGTDTYIRCNLSNRKHLAHEEIVAKVYSSRRNAALIAAAPELLTWVIELLEQVKRDNPHKMAGVIEHVERLIERANGGAK